MAGGAIAAQAAFVYVAAAMAGDTVAWRTLERAARMTLTAPDDGVHAQQRETRQIVIKADFTPACFAVTALAPGGKAAGVYVVAAMAAGAIGA